MLKVKIKNEEEYVLFVMREKHFVLTKDDTREQQILSELDLPEISKDDSFTDIYLPKEQINRIKINGSLNTKKKRNIWASLN